MKKEKGFTLIELLVVIAIIGLLSSVVLVSVDSSRVKARDVAVKAGMKSAKTQADAYYEMNSTFLGICSTVVATYPHSINPIVLAAAKSGGVATSVSLNVNASGIIAVCNVNLSPQEWAAEVPMVGSTAAAPRMFCIDSLGSFKETTGRLGVESSQRVCP